MTTGLGADPAPLIVKKGVGGMTIVNGPRSEVAAMLNAVVDMMNAIVIAVKGTMDAIGTETATETETVIVVAPDTMTENGIAIEAGTVTVTEAVTGIETEIAIPVETMPVMVVDGDGAAMVVLAVVEVTGMEGQMVVCLAVQTLDAVPLLKAPYLYQKGLENTPHGMSNLLVTQMYLQWKPKYQAHSCYPVKRDLHLKPPVVRSTGVMEMLLVIWR